MTHCLLLASSLLAMSGPSRPESPEERARRAAMVDRIMAEPSPPFRRLHYGFTFEEEGPIPAVEGGEGEDGDDELKMAAVPPLPPRVGVRLARANFDSWLFGTKVEDGPRREWLSYRLEAKIAGLASGGRLDSAQVEKLRLAGKGDVKRFNDRVEGMRARYEDLRSDIGLAQNFLSLGLKSLSDEFQAGPFGGSSLFEKTFRKIEGDRKAVRRGD